jgi:uncharacterized protein YraI
MKIKYIAIACLAGVTTLIFSATAVLAQLYTVNNSELNVRQGPGTKFPVTYVLRQGDLVEVTRRQGEWAFVVGERGGEGWVYARYLTAKDPAPSSTPNANQVFKSQGTIDNSRYKGPGEAQLVIVPRDNNSVSFSLTQSDRFSLEYLGTVRSNFEGTVQIQVTQLRSSAMGYRTVTASGTCDIQTSGGNIIRQSFCTVSGNGIDHGRSNFTARRQK